VEAVLMMLTVTAVAAAAFAAPVLRDHPLSFLCVPPLAWIAFRYGPREVATAIALLAAIAVLATETGVGPFVMGTRNESLLVLQAFMATVVITLLPMAALVREHRLAVAKEKAATRARDVFLAMLSHELRNPLQAIASALHILALPEKSTKESRHALAIASRQTDHLTRLLNDLLDVARAVSGKIVLETRAMRLDEATRHCVDLLRDVGRHEGRTLTIDAHPVVIRADAARVEQIVGNLLSNAVKFTSTDGTIRVMVREEGGMAVLRVQDDGIGISGELLPEVFELFVQGERTLDRREGGMGIGLTLVRKLAELQGGSAEARSAGPGEGSEFIVRFPLATERVASEPAVIPGAAPPVIPGAAPPVIPGAAIAAMARDPIPKPRVLIIEDNLDAREALHAALTAEGHEVHDAVDGEKGIEIAERVRPDVVLVDIGLPQLDGYEVARRLRAIEASLGVHWRLIALTGYGQPEDVRRAEQAGFDAHLVKPVFPSALQEAMVLR
jgi:signal transduction histidine kinase/ActR/RegA family two-component response regulator